MEKFYSTIEAARILGISRIEVFRKIKRGKLKAQKVGRNYVIPYETLKEMLGKTIGENRKEEIDNAINKALKEYKEVFIKLSKE